MFARCLFVPLFACALAGLASLPATRADGPGDNLPDNVRPVPPKGSEVPEAVKEEVRKGLAELQGLIKDIGKHELLADVLIYEKAVRWALDHNEVFDPAPPKDKNAKAPAPAGTVKKVLAAGLERARALKEGKTPWATQTGGVLRGYVSKIDGSVQPYWVVVPTDYDFKGDKKHRLDFWWHGRYENTVEAGFMANSPGGGGGIIPAPGALILHPFGRFSNANKFAGEVDTFECLEHAKKHYRVDESRLVARGFSMGGAACWQFSTHFPTLWCANAPGAGFSETPEFLNVFQNEKVEPAWYEKKLWHMYNATDYAINLFNLPTVAYSGEIDRQKQAADVMAREMKKEGLELVHLIGPKTGHSYEKAAKEELNKRIDAIVAKGKPAVPEQIKFTTFTLRYNQCAWVTVEGLAKHWERARVEGEIKDGAAVLKTEGVTALTIRFPAGAPNAPTKAVIDGSDVAIGKEGHFRKGGDGKWQAVPSLDTNNLRKLPGLQGPIDDAFMDSFVMVAPTGKPLNDAVGKWAEKEMAHAVKHWRQQYRGDAPVKKDTEVTEADIKNSNLVLWGDPSSNAVLAKIADKLPIEWGAEAIAAGNESHNSKFHVPVLIYPNPLNLQKYVVVNSGFTFREYDYLNNARQVSKMPDYAVLDITTPVNSRYPGKVVRAGFFGEKWELLPNDGQ
ncbi:prolyl oligopeptidase family protein : Prolyl oligopeptidase family protein OS=Singulisphaera acidiphila (strain ATCC BAA-1392 / DSM 18658 / VKM B-2454 / MOB10) GN=Sinac_5332 PE=4 SV=1: Peptidase_S9 [Gemmataceae bacterium]|nr:prolyl oligopeptidase family protein : Prolyl oligopeptidase family protein OS=Singulisphaera acidiphila (strain ATCC BAA-1392 / DSM 18658 / VKM B-2454 / MOB10) GN=Sinac_5332 PE=4 SV=1: Peptidase_S9 [Gemmataceae bacterium]VTT99391.1 prolyl oligopeptidase family protein : Prolyl oligopeptidase family protein OS=Singulisphaera acidiphila (strain ATCC BAA-1392 / DSM 18658 / VKM B-2454 / MOB10) GN=Sinac_5332 PE=4 SV=1: Peptidase_S9 [Gemmataceae bacterium]